MVASRSTDPWRETLRRFSVLDKLVFLDRRMENALRSVDFQLYEENAQKLFALLSGEAHTGCATLILSAICLLSASVCFRTDRPGCCIPRATNP